MGMSPHCWCYNCDVEYNTQLTLEGRSFAETMCCRMNLCPDCGNKRCPKATSHNLECSGSNDLGQPGSRYA